MKNLYNKIFNSEFLTFNEVLRLKVSIVTIFLFIFVILSIPLSAFNGFKIDLTILFAVSFVSLLMITILLTIINQNRLAMHFSIYTIIGLTMYFVGGSSYFYGYILFFVTLTIIIFYQDIYTYLIYGGAVTVYGVIYVMQKGVDIMGVNSSSLHMSNITYQAVLVGFYIVFLIQFIVSDNIYEGLNNEWVRMNKILEKYQDYTMEFCREIALSENSNPIFEQKNFQKAVIEISVFVNEFFEEDGTNIIEAVEFYFFLHSQKVEEIVDSSKIGYVTKKYAQDFSKYLLNNRSELMSILFDFSTIMKVDNSFQENRYEYNISKLLDNKIDKFLGLAILYKYLRTEATQYDKWGKITKVFTHDEISELFLSKEFREFISFEQANFFFDNQELFNEYLA
ncbi:MAG: hypothetical protein QM489_06495 [Candidatus Izemoplasma sp.]